VKAEMEGTGLMECIESRVNIDGLFGRSLAQWSVKVDHTKGDRDKIETVEE
jgi:hypothetical protein